MILNLLNLLIIKEMIEMMMKIKNATMSLQEVKSFETKQNKNTAQ